jgi:membrane protease YdiL (CAAX protease family)
LPQVATLFQSGHASALVALLALVSLAAMVIVAVGIIAYVAVGASSPTRAARGYGSLGTILACLGAAVIVANLLSLPYAIAAAQAHHGQNAGLTPGGLVLSIVLLDGALLGVTYLRIVRPGVLTWGQLGLTLAGGWPRVGLGVGVGIFVIVASAAIETALEAIGIQQTQAQMFAGVQGASVPQFVGVLLGAAVLAPIAEEIFFRGYVFTAVRQTRGLVAAYAVSAVLFTLAHLNLQAFLPILLIGLTFCYVYQRTGSLVPTIVAHAMNNAVALLVLYLAPK